MTTIDDSDDWSKASGKFVAFFDVMGFKDFVYTNPHSKVVERIDFLYSFTQVITTGIPIANGRLPPLNEYLKVILVSDSIIICSKGDSEIDFLCMVNATGALLSGCLDNDIPIKGAISHGLFTFDETKSIYVGKPLISASLIEASLEFYGCVLDHCVEKRIEELGIENFYRQIPAIKTPTKDGKIRYHTAKISLPETIEVTFNKFYKTVSGKARRYVDNSIDVYQKLEAIK